MLDLMTRRTEVRGLDEFLHIFGSSEGDSHGICNSDVTGEMTKSAITPLAQANVRDGKAFAIQDIETTGAWVRIIVRNTPSLAVKTKSRPSCAPRARYRPSGHISMHVRESVCTRISGSLNSYFRCRDMA